jgi:hypothetical protein
VAGVGWQGGGGVVGPRQAAESNILNETFLVSRSKKLVIIEQRKANSIKVHNFC